MSAIYFPEIFRSEFEQPDLYRMYFEHLDPTFQTVHVSFLKRTFRFSQNLACILDEHLYHSGFYGSSETGTKICLIDSPHFSGSMRKNGSPEEAKKIAQYLNTEVPEDYAILTPYRVQRQMLRRKLGLPEDKVLTVHGSQGREWNTVIISVVDAREKFFMSSDCKGSNGARIVNTAVSRCKKNLVLVMDFSAWEQEEGELLTQIAKLADYNEG